MIHIDSHGTDLHLTHPFEVASGWFTGGHDDADILLGSQLLAHSRIDRPDLDDQSQGFHLYVDLVLFVGTSEANASHLTLSIRQGGHIIAERLVAVSPEAWKMACAAREARLHKRKWLCDTICHPLTGEAPSFGEDFIAFAKTGERFSQRGYGALNLLDPSFPFTGHLSDKTDGVSAHHYPTPLQHEIEALVERGGMALDFGAGLKKSDHPNIVRMEIFDYPSTDILCVGQKLPFPDACFDMVMTLAVLEHVDDPFACASEIMRVLKPGGRLFSGVPFLQPEHGYPDHYFNMTRSGHRRVYGERLEVERHLVDDHQHPFFSLQWILNSYRNGLDAHARSEFSKMSVEDLINIRYWRDRKAPIIASLSESAQWELASATTLIGRKR